MNLIQNIYNTVVYKISNQAVFHTNKLYSLIDQTKKFDHQLLATKYDKFINLIYELIELKEITIIMSSKYGSVPNIPACIFE